MRKSILACTVSVLMSPIASWALGMGDIQVNSTLNQALKAEIELHSAAKKDLDSLHIGLASRKAYARSNIEFSDYLQKFRFKVIQRNGKNYISISTRKPFKEPYANFLIEANWGSGRLLREYTMLVDPPEFVKTNARTPSMATTSRTSQVKRTTQSSSGTVTRTQSAPSYTSGSGGLVYGPTRKHDTLWNIAKKMAPANVSVNQMMMALLRDNPEAFVANNINNLKAGYVLRIKDTDNLTQLDRRTARHQVHEQYQSWKETRKQQVSTVSPVDRSDRSADDKKASDGELKLIATGDTDSEGAQGSLASEAKTLKEKLALTSEELESREVENQELKARIKELEKMLKTKTSLVQLKDESLAALQKQKAMQAQGGDTDSSVEEQTNTEITDETVESADGTVSEVIVAIEKVEQPEMANTEATESVVPSDGASDTEADVTETVDKVEPATDTADKFQSSTAEEAMAVAKSETQKSAAEKAAEKLESKVTKKPTAPEPEPVQVYEPTLEDDPVGFLLSEKNLPYTAGGGGILILLLAWLGLRGRGKKETEFEESILDSQIAMDDSEFATESTDSSADSGTEVLAADTETSFLSDFSSDDMETLQPDDTEADPIAEADVFMVYGRYQQAEELLKTAIDKEPERVDYQMKLLEVYHGDNQKDAFAVQADVVRDVLSKTNDDFELTSEWTRARSWAEKLGVDIEMPDSFDNPGAATAVETEDATTESTATDEFSLDDFNDELTLDTTEIEFNEDDSVLGDLDTDASIEIEDESSDEMSLDDIDFDSDEPTEDSTELKLDDIDELDEQEFSEQIDDMSDDDMFELDENTSDTDLSLDAMGSDESSLQLDDISDDELSIDADELLDIEATDDTKSPLDSGEGGIDLESSLELEESLELQGGQEQSDVLAAELSDDSFELDMDNDSSEDDLELLDNDMNFDELDDDFPELDAVGTKLDLAKAYIDMGDMESASSILNEVIDEGDEDQKTQAQELLDQSSS